MEEEYKFIYDSIQLKPVIPKKTYPLNKENIKLYLESSNPEFVPILKKLFSNTTHISYKTFKFVLYNNFRELIHYCKKRNIKVISLYLDKIDGYNITYKSNFWVAQHFYQFLKKKKIDIKLNIIYNYKDIQYLDENELILILDDCSYTGYQLSGALEYKFNTKKKFNIYIIITFITNDAIQLLKKTRTNNNIIISKNNVIIKDFFHYLTPEEQQLTLIKMNMANKYPIYFDHKLADIVSTYTNIYSGLVINSNKIIPVITNCEHIIDKKQINEMSPKCPISPYKINSADFDINKDNIKIKSSSLSSTFSSLSNRSLNRTLKKITNSTNDNNFNLVHYKDYISFIEDRKINYFANYKDKKILQLYELLKTPPKKPEKSYNLDTEKIKNYYKMILPEVRPIIKKVLDNTIHISYPTYIKDLLLKIDELKKYLIKHNIKTIKLYIENSKTTNRWVSQHLYHNLEGINIIIINKLIYINQNDFVIYADDFIVNEYDIKSFFNIKKNKLPSYTIYILTSYISNRIYNKLKTYLNVKNPKLLLCDNIKKVYQLNKYLTKEEIDTYYKYTITNIGVKYPIYADYNIYSNFTIPILIYYGAIIDEDYNKFTQKNKFYSLINNCDTNDLKILNPVCPPPIYLSDISDSGEDEYVSSGEYSSGDEYDSNESSLFDKSSSKRKNDKKTKVKKPKEDKETKVKKPKDDKEIKIKKPKDDKETKVKKPKDDKETKVKKPKDDKETKVKKPKDDKETKIKKPKDDKERKERKEKERKERKDKERKEQKEKERKERKEKERKDKKQKDKKNKKDKYDTETRKNKKDKYDTETKINKTKKDIKKCPDGKILNPETNRCVNANGKIGKMIIKK
jgi:hypothetical protein